MVPNGTCCPFDDPAATHAPLSLSPDQLHDLYHSGIDELERRMMGIPALEMPVTHSFVPGFYVRQIFMPAGAVLTSKIHKTEHPYVITKGRVRVLTEDGGIVELAAPHSGITKPGTRRLLEILEDTVWTTFHPTDLTDVDAIEEAIIEKRDAHRAGLVQPKAAALEGVTG